MSLSAGPAAASLTGACKELTVECSGASQMNADDLTADTVTAELSDASSAQLNAKEELTAEASGASHLRYTGQPAKLTKRPAAPSTVSGQ